MNTALKALADPTRLRILGLVAQATGCCRVVDACPPELACCAPSAGSKASA
jgi:DNA-binding transcriptional ArsR family regulator